MNNEQSMQLKALNVKSAREANGILVRLKKDKAPINYIEQARELRKTYMKMAREKGIMATAKDVYRRMEDTFVNLHNRWLDEREFENFNDYIDVVKSNLAKCNVEFVSMSKRPFSFKFKIDGMEFEILMKQYKYILRWK